MRRGFKKWCEEQAIHWRKELDLPVHVYLPARQLADRMLIDVFQPIDIPELAWKDANQLLQCDVSGWSAVTVSTDGCIIIIYNPNHSPARQEADIMHELAHIICGHSSISFKNIPWFPFPLREYRKADEEEAKWLGSCLQIPRDSLVWALNCGMTQHQAIAEHFVASVQMVQFRRNMTGVDVQRRRMH